MSKHSFKITGTDRETGFEILITTLEQENFTFTDNGVAMSPQPSVVNNKDGTYIIEYDTIKVFGLKINGSEQDEFKNITLVGDDILLESQVDGVSIQLNGSGDLELIDYNNILFVDSLVDGLNSYSISGSATANQSRILNERITSESLAKTSVVDNLTSTSMDPLSANQGKVIYDSIKSEFPISKNYISENLDTNDNLQRLDLKLNQVATGTGITSYRQIYCDALEADLTAGDEIPTAQQWTETNINPKTKLGINFMNKSTDTKLIFNCQAKGSSLTEHGIIRLKVEEGSYIEINVTDTIYTLHTGEVDISEISEMFDMAKVAMSVTGSGTLYMRYPILEIQTG